MTWLSLTCVGQIAAADALLICTPEYAGALPGASKNLLEWTVGDAGTYRKPVAWINASGPAAPAGGADAHDSLRKVLGYLQADLVEDACVRLPLTRGAVGMKTKLIIVSRSWVRSGGLEAVAGFLERHLSPSALLAGLATLAVLATAARVGRSQQ